MDGSAVAKNGSEWWWISWKFRHQVNFGWIHQWFIPSSSPEQDLSFYEGISTIGLYANCTWNFRGSS